MHRQCATSLFFLLPDPRFQPLRSREPTKRKPLYSSLASPADSQALRGQCFGRGYLLLLPINSKRPTPPLGNDGVRCFLKAWSELNASAFPNTCSARFPVYALLEDVCVRFAWLDDSSARLYSKAQIRIHQTTQARAAEASWSTLLSFEVAFQAMLLLDPECFGRG